MRGKHRRHSIASDEREVGRAAVKRVYRLAREQHGLVARRQLLELGLRPNAIDRRIESRRLIRVRRGVYRLGPIAQPLEREMAAILVCDGGAISHHTAAAIDELLPYVPKEGPVHVTMIGSDRGPKPGIRIHRTSDLPPGELTRRHRIPLTTPARTILDLAAALTAGELEQLVARAHHRNLATAAQLRTLVARYPGRPGTPALSALLAGKPKHSRSRSERRLLEAFRRASLPEPETNVPIDRFEVDLLWREQRLAVEIDGSPFHSTRPDRLRDYARDARLGELGFTVLRLDADLASERAVALVAGALARATR